MQLQRAMRLLWPVVMCWATRAMADPTPTTGGGPPMSDVPLHPGFTLRLGFHHTSVEKSEGKPNGYGPKLELEATLRPIEYISIGGFVAYTRYASPRLHDPIVNTDYDANYDTWALGGRIYVQPHWRVFGGIGMYYQSEREDLGALDPIPNTYSQTVTQFILGANVAHSDHFLFQLAGTYSSYTQFFGLERVTIYGLVLGVHGE